MSKGSERHRHHHVSRSPAHPPIARYAPNVWHRDHRFAIGLIVASTALTLFVGFLGPSVVTLSLGKRRSLLPPWYLPGGWIEPNEWFVTILTWSLIIIGSLGLFVGLRAVAGGWRPNPKKLVGLGLGLNLATILVPPLTSADVLIYAGYGRLQMIGRNPYEITPAEVFRGQFDPVLSLTERPWWDTPSVYGPITSWTQLAANYLGGESMHDIVFWLQVAAVVPFLIACLAVVWMARDDPRRQGRAALLSLCNPLLIWGVVAGAHNEAMSVMFAVLGLMMMRRNPFAAGLGIGLAGCAKLSIGIWGLAMLWAYRREPKKAVLLCLGTLVPMGLAYGLWQPTALVQVLRNGTYVSVGSWANPVFRFFDLFLQDWVAKLIVGAVAYVGLVVIARMLSKVVPWTPAPGLARGADPRQDPMTITLRTALILSVAWLVTSMYTLPWYDLMAWMPLALMVATKLDRIMLHRITWLTLAYIPGRAVDLSPELDFVATRVRDTLSPIVQVGVLIAIVWWWKRPDRPELLPWRAKPEELADRQPVSAGER